MIMTITDTAAAAELQAMAIALLPPGLRALAEEFGLFGLRLQEIEDDLPDIGDLTNRQAAFDPRLSQAERDEAYELTLDENRRERERIAAIAENNRNRQTNVIIDGESVASAITRAQSEGAG